jgi:hypothetical protein
MQSIANCDVSQNLPILETWLRQFGGRKGSKLPLFLQLWTINSGVLLNFETTDG